MSAKPLLWAGNLRPTLDALSIYDVPPADRTYARLHANECPEPWPAEVMEQLGKRVAALELGRYPDTSGRALRATLGATLGCDPERIVLGNGSDEIINLILTALSRPTGDAGVIVTPTPTFVMYGHTAQVLGMEVRPVLLTEQLELDEAAMLRALPGASVCFLARPNNPTGNLWDAEVIARLIAAHPEVVFVIDEAYVGYAPDGSSLWDPDAADNVVYMSTLSKVGLAALRLGYCVAHPTLATALNKVRHPYNISQTSLCLAGAVLEQFGEVQRAMVQRARENRARLVEILSEIEGAQVLPSAGNLVLVRLPGNDDAPRLRAHLADQRVLVKDVSGLPRLERCLRVSVGTPEELDRLHAALRQWPAGQ